MECLYPRWLPLREMLVPCGKCGFCGATRRSDWAIRLKYERRMHMTSRFVTLTYANPHLVWKDGNPQVHRPHTQLFFKRLRKAGYKLRYYGVAEYGSQTFRPHYHVLLFGDIPEQAIRDAWTYGQTHIGTVTDESVMYCLSYMINKNGWKMSKNRVRTFNMMSKGIGKNYLTKAMIAWHKSGRKNYALVDGKKRHLPRYYKLKIFNRLDQIRIAYYAQREQFQNLVKWIRDPLRRRMADPLAYYQQVMKQMEANIRFKAKSKQLI